MALSEQQRQRYRTTLLDMRRRIAGSVGHVVDAMHDEAKETANSSGAPVHLADVAQSGIVADAQVLDTETTLITDIDHALERVADGSYGACESCGANIATERLEALPFATRCTACAAAGQDQTHSRHGSPIPEQTPLRLTGFEAIEFAEREGLSLNKAADRIDDELTGMTIAEAEAIAADRPELIWIEVPAGEYYGQSRNMKPGR